VPKLNHQPVVYVPTSSRTTTEWLQFPLFHLLKMLVPTIVDHP
jgi:hypothetical protein